MHIRFKFPEHEHFYNQQPPHIKAALDKFRDGPNPEWTNGFSFFEWEVGMLMEGITGWSEEDQGIINAEYIKR
jgi:hypothetical protein